MPNQPSQPEADRAGHLAGVTALAAPTRWMLIAAAFLVVGAGLDLFLFPEHTGTLFAWAIDPPLTAAFLGANYLAAGVVEIGAARQSGSWPGEPCCGMQVSKTTCGEHATCFWRS
jgi:hypothetical protein